MSWVALNCPQCSAPLPRVAIWRSVKCASCGALITRTEAVVLRESFRKALARERQDSGGSVGDIQCGGNGYHLMQHLGSGEVSEVYLARRVGSQPYLATIKLSTAPAAAAKYAREAEALRVLHDAQNDGASRYAFQRLPEVIAQGSVDEAGTKQALVLRHPLGYWGSLAALSARFPHGIDPRHAVWIWRRLLDVLHFVHVQGWRHGSVRPEHALVHPGDHGVRLIDWAAAQRHASEKDRARDLMHSARVVTVLLSGANGAGAVPSGVPAAFAELAKRAAEEEGFCRAQGAQGLDALLRAAALEAFGTPTFLPLVI